MNGANFFPQSHGGSAILHSSRSGLGLADVEASERLKPAVDEPKESSEPFDKAFSPASSAK